MPDLIGLNSHRKAMKKLSTLLHGSDLPNVGKVSLIIDDNVEAIYNGKTNVVIIKPYVPHYIKTHVHTASKGAK